MAKLGLDSRRCIFGDHDFKHYSIFLVKEEVLFKTYQLHEGKKGTVFPERRKQHVL